MDTRMAAIRMEENSIWRKIPTNLMPIPNRKMTTDIPTPRPQMFTQILMRKRIIYTHILNPQKITGIHTRIRITATPMQMIRIIMVIPTRMKQIFRATSLRNQLMLTPIRMVITTMVTLIS